MKEILIKISKKKKPVILATGASNISEVIDAVKVILKNNKKLILMQCNTNYTADENNFNYINLKVLNKFKSIFKDKIILGLSDHTLGHTTVLGAVALGAKVVEKHFTDNNKRTGPDHKFAMNPITWSNMVKETRRLEKAMGNGTKIIEKNEKRIFFSAKKRCLFNKNLKKGHVLQKKDMVCLRPYVKGTISPFFVSKIIGKKINSNLKINTVLKEKWID